MAGDRSADAAPSRFATSPQDRISFERKLAYGAGAFVNNLLITEQAAHDVRARLEARRGAAPPAATAAG